MARLLFAYATTDGHTRRVTERLAAVARDAGHEVTVVDVGAGEAPAVEGFDLVAFGGSVHLGALQKPLLAYARDAAPALGETPTGLYVVCLAASQTDDAARRECDGYVEQFVDGTGVRPTHARAVAGVLAYTRYNVVKRFALRQIARLKGLSTDTSRDHEHTDWNDVERFGRALAEAAAALSAPSRS